MSQPSKPRLPETLRDARELFATSDVAREAFGEEVVDHYLNAADVELAGLPVGGHRLGAGPRVRAAVSGDEREAMAVLPEPRSAAAGIPTPLDAVFAPVRSHTAFEETVERLGTAIKLGLLRAGHRACPPSASCAPGWGSPARPCARRWRRSGRAATCFATRGRRRRHLRLRSPAAGRPALGARCSPSWREICDQRMAVEVGVAVLAAERAEPGDLDALDEVAAALDETLEDFAAYRQADIRLHVGLAEATRSPRLVRPMTEAQGAMSDLIAYIAHPPEVLASSNAQHRRLLAAVRERRCNRAPRGRWPSTCQGTEHMLAGLLPGG